MISLLLWYPSYSQAKDADSKVTQENFQDWQLICYEMKESRQCQIQQVFTLENGEKIGIINVSYSHSETLIEIILPLMTDLTKPLEIKFNENEFLNLEFNVCSSNGCFVIQKNNFELLDFFISEVSATIKANTFNGDLITLNSSLKGFGDAYNALKKRDI